MNERIIIELSPGQFYEFLKIPLSGTAHGWQVIDMPAESMAVSTPPSGYCKVKNLYFDPSSNKLVVEYDQKPIS